MGRKIDKSTTLATKWGRGHEGVRMCPRQGVETPGCAGANTSVAENPVSPGEESWGAPCGWSQPPGAGHPEFAVLETSSPRGLPIGDSFWLLLSSHFKIYTYDDCLARICGMVLTLTIRSSHQTVRPNSWFENTWSP